jgi:tRNA threonylcarbamoyladenosine biosynthesis protein TsaB
VLILAIDTSTFSGSIALVKDGLLVQELTSGDVGTHSNWLMPGISALLAGVHVHPDQIDYIALTNGPGSFTGLRIGVSVVKGLAWTLGKRIVGVSTLKALAYNLRYCSALVCPILDARKSEVYAAVYRFTGGGHSEPGGPGEAEQIMEDSALSPERLADRLNEIAGHSMPGGHSMPSGHNMPVIFTGSGLNVYRDLLASRVKGAIFARPPLWHIRASNVAEIASEAVKTGEETVIKPAVLKPLYLRKSEAELKSAH